MVSKALGGVTVLQKGPVDIIATNTTGASSKEAHEISKIPDNVPQEQLEEETVTKVDTLGGFKRVGGQGDILSGCAATWLAWGKCYETGAFGYVFLYVALNSRADWVDSPVTSRFR